MNPDIDYEEEENSARRLTVPLIIACIAIVTVALVILAVSLARSP